MRRVCAAITAAIFVASLSIGSKSIAGVPQEGVCDVGADYCLGIEDYMDAIRLHREILSKDPHNALAHYHLGFAEGMIGDRMEEIGEYRQAAALGLRNWDLFLNLGLAQFERGDLKAARDSLLEAVVLGGEHPESHFNLALVDERCELLAEAEQETRASLLLSPEEPDALNLLAVIYAEEGKVARAAEIWLVLSQDEPDYEPAHRNLTILNSASEATDEGRATVFFPGGPNRGQQR